MSAELPTKLSRHESRGFCRRFSGWFVFAAILIVCITGFYV